MDLFEHNREKTLEKTAPLAARMRPRTLDEFVGQNNIIGPGRLLRRAIQADQLSSLIFYGPPGTGKTTLARIIANTTHAHFTALNAVLSGVKDIREAIAAAKERLGMFGQRTILFIDEVHRFNKAQQDALLPHVENGTVILIGATTENPYFEVNKALVSRSRIFELTSLTEDDLRAVAYQALADDDRGYGKLKINLSQAALDHLVNVANGDARALLNAIELAVETTPPDEYGLIDITTDIAEESIQRRAVLYDRDGDAHFDTISAFIKSLRGSDPDAALYWMIKMLYAGEDPRFIFRRMLIMASEDVGLADPQALGVVTAAAQAFDYVGMPEGRFHLSQACLYLATCPKSNATMGFFDAWNTVEAEREAQVPDHLRDASRDADDLGHGQGYLYPHAYRDHWVAQQYLPDSLQGKVFYNPSDQGYEGTIQPEVIRRREAQLAAMLEPAIDDHLAWSPKDSSSGPRTQNQWLRRTLSNTGQQLGQTRDRLFKLADLKRDELVLDLNAGTGLLTWEAIRRTPTGGVWSLAGDERTAAALRQHAENLDALSRPVVLTGSPTEIAALVTTQEQGGVLFELIIGRNALTRLPDKPAALALLKTQLAPGGRLALVETIPRHTQRLYELIDLGGLAESLRQRLIAAEEAIYEQTDDPLVNWDAADLSQAAAEAGFAPLQLIEDVQVTDLRLGAAHLERWFDLSQAGERPSYAQHLLTQLSAAELETIRTLFENQLLNQTVKWRSRQVFMAAGTHPSP